jgi:hypothetical protein
MAEKETTIKEGQNPSIDRLAKALVAEIERVS